MAARTSPTHTRLSGLTTAARISRTSAYALPARLEAIARDSARLQRMQQAGRRLWVRYGERGPVTVLGVLANTAWVRAQIAVGRPAHRLAD